MAKFTWVYLLKHSGVLSFGTSATDSLTGCSFDMPKVLMVGSTQSGITTTAFAALLQYAEDDGTNPLTVLKASSLSPGVPVGHSAASATATQIVALQDAD